MLVKSWAITDRGRQRLSNEDCYFLDPESRLLLVLDGMGGHRAGEVASKLAMETIAGFYMSHSQENGANRDVIEVFDQSLSFQANMLRQAAFEANRLVLAKSEQGSEFGGMGSTLTGLAINDSTVSMVNVGDSRIYLIRNKTIEQMSKDHTLAEDQVERGIMSREEARDSQLKHILSSVIGVDSKVRIHTDELTAQPGDAFLLCTDGLTAVMSDEEILAFLEADELGPHTLERMVDKVNERGGPDNVTLALAVFMESDSSESLA